MYSQWSLTHSETSPILTLLSARHSLRACCKTILTRVAIDLLHKSQNASVQYPKVHHFVTEMCTNVYISVTDWCIVGCLSNELMGFVRWNYSFAPGLWFRFILFGTNRFNFTEQNMFKICWNHISLEKNLFVYLQLEFVHLALPSMVMICKSIA